MGVLEYWIKKPVHFSFGKSKLYKRVVSRKKDAEFGRRKWEILDGGI
jgi:hypothetical protein